MPAPSGVSLMSPKFAILGAGLMGRLLAVSLARLGHRVEVHEKGQSDAATSAAHVAAAMLAPLAESVVSEPLVVELGIASLKRWPAVLETLPGPVFFQKQGTLVVWHPQDRDQAALFSSRLGLMDDRFVPEHRARSLDAAGIATLEPALEQRFSRGLYLPEEGQLDNRAVLSALGLAMTNLQIPVYWGQESSPDSLSADWVIDCRGSGAKPNWPQVRGVRGEVLRVEARDITLGRPIRLLHPRYPIYIAPKEAGIFVIGATQIETEDTSPTSVRSALELLSALYSVHPAFGEARILEMKAQCRPALPDNLPGIRWNGERLIQINGLYRHGFMMAPAMLDATLSLISNLVHKVPADWDSWRAAQPWPSLFHSVNTVS